MSVSVDIIFKYFPRLSETQKSQFEQLDALYREWNAQINVISRKDMDLFYEHHVLHSLAIAKILKFRDESEILDVGTGGGFPGIPLAIMFPEVKFTLVDSIGKKIKVVNAVAEALQLQNVSTKWGRVEEINHPFDFIISRAVTQFPEFLNWVKDKKKKHQRNSLPNGILYLKGGDLSEELKGFEKRCVITEIKTLFQEEYFETKKVVYYPL